jgi:hypothetical protein
MTEKEKTPPGSTDPDAEFWDREGVTDDEEKEAIKSRARVIAYADYRRKKAEDDSKDGKGKKSKRPRWYKEE